MPNDHATKLSNALRKLSKSSILESANVKTELADENVSVQFMSKNKEAVEPIVLHEGTLALADGITVQQEDKMVPVCEGAAPETASSLPYNIPICVQRPSPIREVSSSHRKLFSVGVDMDSKDGEQEIWHESMPVNSAAGMNSDVAAKVLTSPNVDKLASSADNVSSNIITKVRPISGPATITCAERPEFDFVRKSRSVTNSLDEDAEGAGFVVRSRRSVGAITSMTQDTSLPPVKGSIRRIYSTVSFDRQSVKSPGSSLDIDEAADLSAHGIPVQLSTQKANLYGLRSRHTSGLETPMSMLDTSSVTSMGEAGNNNIIITNG